MKYQKFTINNYKAIYGAEVNLASDGLVLLLGINESGKTSVLRAIESFDHLNDIQEAAAQNRFYKSIRNKRELDSTATVTAEIQIELGDHQKLIEIFGTNLPSEKHAELTELKTITIQRVFKYRNAEFEASGYVFANGVKALVQIVDPTIETELCKAVLKKCPSIQYFEDFKDQIPDFISLTPGAQYYDPDWASTIEGLFFHADPNVTVEQFQNLTDVNARSTVLNKVNLALNKQFTDRWNKKLKGVKSIHRVNLVYSPNEKLFTFEIVGADGVTVFAIGERSKGALWYFTFLLKTEFRKRKLRAELGKTLYLIDEPGSNLHSSAQTNMVTDFRTLASDSNVIYTTHSQYLLDKENLSNIYIVESVRSTVRVIKFQEYLQGRKINTSYYQPIIDALQIQPFSLEVPWNKALLVEGIYDYCGFKLLFEKIMRKRLDFVIIPGTGASNLTTLISLHLGWGSKLVVLLDNDEEGRSSQVNYQGKFSPIKSKILTYEVISSAKNFEFENLFTDKERAGLASLAGFSGSVTKKIFQQTLATILHSSSLTTKASRVIGDQTKKNFEAIFAKVAKEL